MLAQIRPAQLVDWLEAVREHGQPIVLNVREPYELRMSSVKADGMSICTVYSSAEKRE